MEDQTDLECRVLQGGKNYVNSNFSKQVECRYIFLKRLDFENNCSP
jgi:hypothetical protein